MISPNVRARRTTRLREWVEKIRAMHLFDDGYEKLRERIFENQKRLAATRYFC